MTFARTLRVASLILKLFREWIRGPIGRGSPLYLLGQFRGRHSRREGDRCEPCDRQAVSTGAGVYNVPSILQPQAGKGAVGNQFAAPPVKLLFRETASGSPG
jgi:hypothetical protein